MKLGGNVTDDEIADIIKSEKWLAAMQKVMDRVPDPFGDNKASDNNCTFSNKDISEGTVTPIDHGADGVTVVETLSKPKLRLIRGGKYGT